MEKISCKLTVFFDAPFWAMAYERMENSEITVCKVTFGAEPRDAEVHSFLLTHWNALQFSPPVQADKHSESKINPKRMQRSIHKQVETLGMGTKSQQALKLQQEKNKLERKEKSRNQKADEKQRQFQLRQQKRKQKHKGK